MRHKLGLICGALFFLLPLHAQQLQPVTSIQPDCGKTIPAIITATTTFSAVVDNRTAGCDGWVVTYSNFNFSPISVLLESAPLSTLGVAGTFVSFAGTITAGPNPATITTSSEIRATGYYPYVRLSITTAGSGILFAEFHGYKSNPNSGGGGGGSGCPNPCPVEGVSATGSAITEPGVVISGESGNSPGTKRTIKTNAFGGIQPSSSILPSGDSLSTFQVTPGLTDQSTGSLDPGVYLTYPYIFNGGSWDQQLSFALRSTIALTSSGNTMIIAGTAAKTTRIGNISISFASTVDVQIVEGTTVSTPCDTGSSNMTGVYKTVQSMVLQFAPSGLKETVTADDVCINLGASVVGGGVTQYDQH